MARWILLFCCAAGLAAQTHSAKSERTSVTSDKLTIQLDPTATPTTAQMCVANVQATVAGTVYVSVGGTAASTTEVTPTPKNPGGKASIVKAYSNSNVGSGTRTTIIYRFQANIPFPLNMKNITLAGPGTTRNVTLVITLDSSGDSASEVLWGEGGGKCEN